MDLRTDEETRLRARLIEAEAAAAQAEGARRFAEREVRRLGDVLRAVTQSTDDPVWVKDLAGRYVIANESAARLVGRTQEQVLGRTDDELLAREDAARIRAADEAVIASGTAATFDRLAPVDGEPRTYLTTLGPYRSGDGSIVGIVGAARDITERVRQAEAEREGRARLHDIIHAIEGIVWEVDVAPEGWRPTFMSHQVERLLGFTTARWLEPGFLPARVHQQDRESLDAALAGSARGGEPFELELRLRAEHDREVWLRVTGRPPSAGPRVAVRGLLLDITERRRAALLLEGQERALEMVAAGAPLAAALRSLCQTIELQQPGCAASILLVDGAGRLRSEVGPSLHDDFQRFVDGLAIGPASSSAGTAAWRRTLVVVEDIESDPLWADARALALAHGLRACWSLPILSAGGEVLGALAIYYRSPRAPDEAEVRSASMLAHVAGIAIERARAEAELLERQRAYETLLGNMSGMAYRARPDVPTLDLVSAGCHALTGYRPAELTSEGALPFVDAVVHPDDRNEVVLQRALDLGARGSSSREYRIVTADGRVRWVWDQAAGVYSSADQLVAIEGFLTDITARREAEEALRASEERQRQSQKMEAVGRLAGGVAHDFNNILTAVTGNTHLLLERLAPGDEARRCAEEIAHAVERAQSVTRQLLAFSRKAVIQPRPIDVNAAIEEMTPLLRRLIGENVELVTALAPRLGWTRADPGQIAQVVLNLTVNARDAMTTGDRRGGRLVIETREVEVPRLWQHRHGRVEAGRWIVISVSDIGVGMDESILSRLFEPFFTTKPRGEGTGLGLPTVLGIVEQTGGSVAVTSSPGAGTTFQIYLPLVPAERTVEPSAAAEPGRSGPGLVVLLVEDDEGVRAVVSATLRRRGYTVLEAPDGVAGLAAIQRHEGALHLVITDVVMPRMSGPELVDHLARERPGLRVLYMSGYPGDELDRLGGSSAQVAFLEKPFTPSQLLGRVRDTLS